MSEFAKYDEMRVGGASPRDVYLAAHANGVDAIKMIRLLRQVFGLSLGEVKQVTGAAEVWSARSKLAPGTMVFWEGRNVEDGPFLIQARVNGIVGGSASLEGHKKFRITANGLSEVPIEGPRIVTRRVSDFEQPLSAQVEKLLQMMDEVSSRNADQESERKAV